MGIVERCEILREQRKNQKETVSEETEKIPFTWPLPKEKRPGENNPDEILSSEEFSQNLVGGRGKGVRPVVDIGTQ